MTVQVHTFRTLPIAASLAGLILVAVAWLVAAAIETGTTPDYHGFTIGYAHERSWLAGMTVYADGAMLAQVFLPNFSQHDGVYAKRTRMITREPSALRRLFLVWPATRGVTSVQLHLTIPLVLFAIACFFTLACPLIRRRSRRKRGLCLVCSYDLRGSVNDVCPECGTEMDKGWTSARQPERSQTPLHAEPPR